MRTMEMITFQVRSGPLGCILMNALTFIYHPFDKALFRLKKEILSVMSSDGYVALKDECAVNGQDEMEFVLAEENLKELYAFTKKVKDLKTKPGWIEVKVTGFDLTAREIATGEEVSIPCLGFSVNDLLIHQLGNFFDVLDDIPSMTDVPVAIHPERLRDIARIKVNAVADIAKGSPLDIRFVENPIMRAKAEASNAMDRYIAQQVMVVKNGPTARLLVAGLNRDKCRGNLESYEEGVSHRCLWE